MERLEFLSLLDRLCTERDGSPVFDVEKIKAASLEEVRDLVGELVQMRAPIIMPLIEHGAVDRNWLGAHGYLYPTQGKFFQFLCTAEGKQKIDADMKRLEAEKLLAETVSTGEDLEPMRLDALRWRKLMGCGRIRVLGSARLGQPDGHMGVEVWGMFPEDPDVNKATHAAQALLTVLVDAFPPPGETVSIDSPDAIDVRASNTAYDLVTERMAKGLPVAISLVEQAGLARSDYMENHDYIRNDARGNYVRA